MCFTACRADGGGHGRARAGGSCTTPEGAVWEMMAKPADELSDSTDRSNRVKRLGVRPVLWRFEIGADRKSGAAARALQDASRMSNPFGSCPQCANEYRMVRKPAQTSALLLHL